MAAFYPYEPPPVVLNAARPATRIRGRRAEAPEMYLGPGGELLVPAGHHPRAASISGPRPAGIQIVNGTVYDDGGGSRRPRSVHYHEDYYRGRSRSHSRHSRHSPSPMSREEFEYKEKLKRLEELEKKDEERELEKQFKEKQLLKKAKEEEEKKEQEELKKKAVEEWKEKEREKKAKEKEEKEKADKEYEERTRKMLWANGYTNAQIDKMMDKSKKHDKGEDVSTSKVIALSRPTYLRIKKKYLDPETLDLYQLPWQWDGDDDNYIIIKKWVNERDQEILFQHTRNLRETKRLTFSTTQFRKDKDNQQLLLVRKKDGRGKSPVRVIRY